LAAQRGIWPAGRSIIEREMYHLGIVPRAAYTVIE